MIYILNLIKYVLTNFDIIIVTAIGYEDDIMNFLTSNYNIDINKIKILIYNYIALFTTSKDFRLLFF